MKSIGDGWKERKPKLVNDRIQMQWENPGLGTVIILKEKTFKSGKYTMVIKDLRKGESKVIKRKTFKSLKSALQYVYSYILGW